MIQVRNPLPSNPPFKRGVGGQGKAKLSLGFQKKGSQEKKGVVGLMILPESRMIGNYHVRFGGQSTRADPYPWVLLPS
jgi:hypothetical protein